MPLCAKMKKENISIRQYKFEKKSNHKGKKWQSIHYIRKNIYIKEIIWSIYNDKKENISLQGRGHLALYMIHLIHPYKILGVTIHNNKLRQIVNTHAFQSLPLTSFSKNQHPFPHQNAVFTNNFFHALLLLFFFSTLCIRGSSCRMERS